MKGNHAPVLRIDVANALLARGYSIEYIRKNYSDESQCVFMFEPAVNHDVIMEVLEGIKSSHVEH